MTRSQKIAAAVIAAAILLFAVPVAIDRFDRADLYYTLSSVALLSVASAGVWLTFSLGRINIGQGAFSLAGGYVAAILVVRYGLSFWLALPLSGLFCAAASVAIGVPILRLRGVYFAMVTLVLTEVMRLLALALPITRGAKGMTSIPPPGGVSVLGVTIIPDFATLQNPRKAFYILSIILMIATFAALYRLVHSRFGQLCRSLQQNEELASSIGVNVALLRVAAYAISSFLGGIGGAMFAFVAQSMYPNSFTVTDSVNFMLNCFLGGLNFVVGPIVGTFVLYFGWDLLFQTGRFQLLIFSTIMIALMLVLPNGLLSIRLRLRGGGGRPAVRMPVRKAG